MNMAQAADDARIARRLMEQRVENAIRDFEHSSGLFVRTLVVSIHRHYTNGVLDDVPAVIVASADVKLDARPKAEA